MQVSLAQDARTDAKRLPAPLVRRILDKIAWFASQADPLRFALPLQGRKGFYRFRIGDYRVIFTLKKETIVILLVLSVKHRSEAYR